MSKIKNDKYYTSPDLAKYVVDKTKKVIGSKDITEYIEPSGGNGVFLDYLPSNTYSCDIEPEDNRVNKKDYLNLNIKYKKGRCIIGNPPFGFMTKLVIQFYKKSVEISDYISFIMPLSFKDNTKQVYDFDLIYSEDLGIRRYSDREINCCFNIYKRPINGLNKNLINKPKKLKDIKIIEVRLGNKIVKDFDYGICSWGSVGKEITNPNAKQFAKEFYFKIYNEQFKNLIMDILKTTNWYNICDNKSTPNLLQWQVYKYLKEQLPQLK